MTIEEQLASAVATANALTGDRDDLRATIEKLTIEASSDTEMLKVEAASKDAKIAELSLAVESLGVELSSFKAQTVALKQTQVSASKQAAAIAASVGIIPTSLPQEGESSKESASHLATFLSMPLGKARSEYFAANSAAIIASAI